MASVKPGDSLEQRLKDPAYKNCLKAGMCLICVNEGLATFVDAESKALHGDILNIYKPCGQCTQDGLRCKNNKKLCPNCCSFKCEIENRHKYKPNWGNTDVQKWLHDHWSVAKCLMNPGQSGNNSASDTDISGLLNFIIHCNNFQDPKYGDIQKNAENVREDRNHLIHCGHDHLSDADLKSYTNDMLKLLIDENPDGQLKGNKEAEKAKIQIQEVLKVNFVILPEDEYKVKLDALEGRVDHINEELEKVKQGDVIKGQEIEKTAEGVRNLEKKYKQIQEDLREVQALKASLQVQDTIIKNLSERVESKFSFITHLIKENQMELEEVKSKIRDHDSQIRDHDSQIRDNKSQIRDHDSQIRDHDFQIRDHGSQIRDHDSKIRDHGEKIEELYARVPKEDEISEKEIDTKEDLKSCYKSLRTVLISAFNEEETIPLEEFDVDMDITLEHQTKDRKKVKFSSYKQILLEKKSRIILTGFSGSGKSTFCRRRVNTWCMEEPKKENETSETTDPSIPDSQKATIGKKEKYQLVPDSPEAIQDEDCFFDIPSFFSS